MLISQSGVPGLVEALLYGIGAITGFGLLSLYVYRSAFVSARVEEKTELVVLSMVHYVGALIPVAAAYYIADIRSPYNFALAGLLTSVLYNLGMVAEELLSERGRELEKKLYRRL
jgi:hypothetical protein